jgi:hypothetical protein
MRPLLQHSGHQHGTQVPGISDEHVGSGSGGEKECHSLRWLDSEGGGTVVHQNVSSTY